MPLAEPLEGNRDQPGMIGGGAAASAKGSDGRIVQIRGQPRVRPGKSGGQPAPLQPPPQPA